MIILGLAGPARSGKDTVADHLVKHYGFVKFAFSDALYDEVQQAYGLDNQDLLRDAVTKDIPSELLALKNCKDEPFQCCAMAILLSTLGIEYLDTHTTFPDPAFSPLPPRQVLQWWGTEYRRAQDPDYWLKKSEEWLAAIQLLYPEQRPQHFVNTAVRFENERSWIHNGESDAGHGCGGSMLSWTGNVWHIRRDRRSFVHGHSSENLLPVWEFNIRRERELCNNDTIERLHQGIDLLMRTNARFVRVEPMEVRGE